LALKELGRIIMLKIGTKVIRDMGDIDNESGLPICDVLVIKRVQFIYDVYKWGDPDHVFEINGKEIKGIME
jgi:hypothetical protein